MGSTMKKRIFIILLLCLFVGQCEEIPPIEPPVGAKPDYLVYLVSKKTDNGTLNDLSNVTFSAAVKNRGGLDTLGTYLYFYVDGILAGDAMINPNVTTSPYYFNFAWKATPGDHIITFKVDIAPNGESFVNEEDESNNVREVELFVPIAKRAIITQQQLSADAAWQMIRTIALDELMTFANLKGLAIDDAKTALRTLYAVEMSVGTIIPLKRSDGITLPAFLWNLEMADSTGLVQNWSFLVEGTDSTTFRIYDNHGGIIARNSGTLLEYFDYDAGALDKTASPNCKEPWFWICFGGLGLSVLICIATILTSATPVTWPVVVLAIAACGAVLPAAYLCEQAVTNQPPTFSTPGVRNGPICEVCEGKNLVRFTYDGYRTANEADDRGPDGPNWLTATEFVPTCDGGSYTFILQDCDGATTSKTVSARYRFIARFFDDPKCKHDGGSGG